MEALFYDHDAELLQHLSVRSRHRLHLCIDEHGESVDEAAGVIRGRAPRPRHSSEGNRTRSALHAQGIYVMHSNCIAIHRPRITTENVVTANEVHDRSATEYRRA